MAKGYPDFEGNKRGLFSVAEWAAREGTDWNRYQGNIDIGPYLTITETYIVTAGKKLYIVGAAAAIWAYAPADFEHMLYVKLQIYNNTTGLNLAIVGGLGGCQLNFTKPLVLAASTDVRFIVTNKSNVNCDISITAWGFEA